jgi:3-hydroxyacyl-CoA dehydrogenase/enoyl-CoA hydratase/3-hydroxybutyryl-CoA epimerase
MTERAKIRNWTLDTDRGDIAWLGLRCRGSTNVLSAEVLTELGHVIDALLEAPPRGLVIFSHKEKGFIAGADINEFPLFENESQTYEKVLAGHAILDRLANLPFPTCAAINGPALGGGLELALACDWRIALPSDQRTLGLPEVQLGVHPGLGGTVRTVKLIGVRQAMQLMLTGKAIRPEQALANGLIDRITSAKSWRADAADLVVRKPGSRSVPFVDMLLNLPIARPLLARVLKQQVRRKANPQHYPAPGAIIDLWQKHGAAKPGYDAEARSFAKLVFSTTSRNLVRVFFLQSRLKDFAKASSRQFNHVHVIGAGTMGGDIASWCAIRGLTVTLQDREKHYVDAAFERAEKTFAKKFKKPDLIAQARNRMTCDLSGEGAREADVIIEAIFENLEAKQALFADMEQRARPDAILATNTSSIPLKDIASVLKNPSKLIGLHFFNPVALMPLIEVVHSQITQPHEVSAGTAFARRIGKLPLPCRGTPGFLVNRILAPYMDEAIRLQSEGIPAEAIDKAARDYGMPVGPLELADSVGLDILVHVADILSETVNRVMPGSLKAMVDAGKLGQKSGSGFYDWQDGKPLARKDVSKRYEQIVQDRLIMSLCNQAVACMGDKVVDDADLVDAGTIFGAGFAPFRGGPLQYLNQAGVIATHERLLELEKAYGKRFAPAFGWKKLLENAVPKS